MRDLSDLIISVGSILYNTAIVMNKILKKVGKLICDCYHRSHFGVVR